MSRFNLPDINFFEKAPELIERAILFHITEQTGITTSRADPRRKFVQALTAYIVQERNNLNHELKQNLLSYAEDDLLEHKGIDTDTGRLQATPARTTMEFILEKDRVSTLTIAAGTLFLVGEDTYFETMETIVVPDGQHIVETLATCTETGEVGNGYLIGEISTLVRPLPWVKSVRNITISAGGAERESDDDYAERIRLSPEKFSTAGPEAAYQYWAKTASQNIVDVVVDSPDYAEIVIYILMRNGLLPDQEDLDKVLDTFNKLPIRPLTDRVSAKAPILVNYDAEVQYWIAKENETVAASIQSKVTEAFQKYLVWQREKMGRDVDLSELIARLKAAGASRVALNSPMFIQIEKMEVAKENVVSLTFGGIADE